MEQQTKPAIRSLGVWAPVVTLVVLLLNRKFPGLGLTDEAAMGIFANAQQMVDLGIATVGTLAGIWGRIRAKGPISGIVKGKE
jgi:hypothetical protein